MCYRRRTRPQDGRRRVPTRGKNRLTMLGEKDGEDARRRPQSTTGEDASGGAEPWAPGGHPGGTLGHGPRQGANRLTMLAEEDGEAALRGPQSTAGGGVSGGVRSRARRALGGEHGLESRRMALCPCGWREEHPGGTRGHGPHQGAKSAYNAPRGGGPGPLGHSTYAIGHGPWAIGTRPCGTRPG